VEVVQSGDIWVGGGGGGGGGEARVTVNVNLAETATPFCVAVTVISREPSSAVDNARLSTRSRPAGITRPSGETESNPLKAEPSLIWTAAVAIFALAMALSGTETDAGDSTI
jgi:hypothetical protein